VATVELCNKYCSIPDFKGKILQKIPICFVLVYNLYRKGVYNLNELKPYLERLNLFVYNYYFKNEIKNSELIITKKSHEFYFDESFIENEKDIEQLIEYGYLPSSIEFCLKYDDIDTFRDLNIFNQKNARWSPFEWSFKPCNFDLLSFSGFFGSIKCFKHLLLNGYKIENELNSIIVCGGFFDIFHLCDIGSSVLIEGVTNAATFCRLELLIYLHENREIEKYSYVII